MLTPLCRGGFSLYGEMVSSNGNLIRSAEKRRKQKRCIKIFFLFFPSTRRSFSIFAFTDVIYVLSSIIIAVSNGMNQNAIICEEEELKRII